ncbi:MAG TPA: transglutaminase-like domain-containing protein [Gemmatimonadales bacterium]|nr:transglutaminase-like domain-containing protein [Gemmatimonadales bacterium]
MSRRAVALSILVAWAAALGWLVDRHYLSPKAGIEESQWPVPPGTAFHTIDLGDRQYGFSSLVVDTLADGLRVTDLLTLDLPSERPRTPRRTSWRVEAIYTRGLQLRRWQSDLLTEQGRLATNGEVSGDTLVTVVLSPRGAAPDTLRVPIRRAVVLPSAIPLVAASRGLPKPGSRLSVAVYDPLDQEERTERLVVAAESLFSVPDSAEFAPTLRRWRVAHADTLRAWRLDSREHGLPVSRWVDASGMIVREDYPLGARLERTAFEIASTNFRSRPPAPWDTAASAPRYQLSDAPPSSVARLTVLARVAPAGHLPALASSLVGGWQVRSGDTIRVAPGADLDSVPAQSTENEVLLRPDSALARQAALLGGRDQRPAAMIRRIQAWVRRSITLKGGLGTGLAETTLARRTGSADDRVLLLVALARAAGVPARPVWGLVQVDDRWQLRSWAECWIGGWTPVDPAGSGPFASAGRVRLAIGGQPRMLDLALRAGRLRLRVLKDVP